MWDSQSFPKPAAADTWYFRPSGELGLSLSRGWGFCICVWDVCLVYLRAAVPALSRQQLEVLAHILQPESSDPDCAICGTPL